MEKDNFRLTALTYYVNANGNVTESVLIPQGSASMASARLQLQPALRTFRDLGGDINVLSLHSEQPSDFHLLKPSRICLIGKMSANSDILVDSMIMANLAAITRLKTSGSKIVLQYCDNFLSKKSALLDFYKDLFAMADSFIFPSKKLQNISQKYIKNQSQSYIISDPWQLRSFHKPRQITNCKTLRLIWFGSNKNLPYLLKQLPNLLSKSNPKLKFELTILGTTKAHEIVKKNISTLLRHGSNWTFRLVPWSNSQQPDQLEFEISRAQLAIIPSDPSDPLKTGVSHNRLVDSIRGGCISIASPMDSYQELSELALLGDDMGDLLNQAIKDYDIYSKKIEHGTGTILSRFSPEKNRQTWIEVWKSILKS